MVNGEVSAKTSAALDLVFVFQVRLVENASMHRMAEGIHVLGDDASTAWRALRTFLWQRSLAQLRIRSFAAKARSVQRHWPYMSAPKGE